MREITDGAVTGKVIQGGIAQSVTREGDLTRIRLTQIGEQPLPRTEYAGVVTYQLPEPVTLDSPGFVVVEMDWAPEASRQPMQAGSAATITSASVSLPFDPARPVPAASAPRTQVMISGEPG